MSDATPVAAEAEATGSPLLFEWGGEQFEIQPRDAWSLETIEAAESGRYASAVRGLVGERQWARLKRQKGVNPVDLFVALTAALGFADPGE